MPAHRRGVGLDVCADRPGPLPFLRDPVSSRPMLARTVDAAFRAPLEPLTADGLVVELAAGLLAADSGGVPARRIDAGAMERARQLLDGETTRVVHSRELESLTGLSRYDVARQFRIAFGTSPYRYQLVRRLQRARERIHRGHALVEVALASGFADQAHFTRAFGAAFGLTPGRYRTLHANAGAAAPRLVASHDAPGEVVTAAARSGARTAARP